MKYRTGFVSNSSSTCFLVNMTDRDKSLLREDYLVVDTEYVYVEDQFVDTRRIGQLESDGYKLTASQHGWLTFSREMNILKPWQGGRSTAMAFGIDLIAYVRILKSEYPEYYENLIDGIQYMIDRYGADNVLFLRQSDESMGGILPAELAGLKTFADIEFEFH